MKTIFLLPRAVRGFFLGGLSLLLCSTAWATTYTVNTNTDTGAGTGTSGDLRYCVTHATSGSDTIVFSSGLSGAGIGLGSEIVFSSSVTIDGSSLATAILLSGNSAHRIFTVSSGSTVSLKVLSLIAGNGSGVTSSGNGGAIYNAGTLTLTGCTISGNAASSGGGAIYNTASLTLTNCTIASNTAVFGAGIDNQFGGVTLTHCTVTGNNGSSGTGGIVLSGGVATFRNSIIAGNTAGSGVTDVDIGGSGTAINMTGNNLIGQNGGSYNTGGLATGTPNVSGDYVGTNGSPVAANLSTLANRGGPVQTMPPNAISVAVDAVTLGNVVSGLTTDASGNARSIDGNSDGTARPDIGATEFVPATFLTVTNKQGTGVGSLRQAIANSELLLAAPRTIAFDPAVAGQAITLASTIAINNPAGLTIDASGLTGGLTINGAGASGSLGLFSNATGSTVAFKGLFLINGGGSGFSSGGGAINNSGTLTLTQCVLEGNSTTGLGGAILNTGFVTLTQCTLSSNSATNDGGAITSTNPGNTATLTQCTLAFNSTNGTSSRGGAIGGFGTLTLTQCTIYGNSASGSSGKGGGVFVGALDTLTVTNCVIAGNTSPAGPDIDNTTGTPTTTGANFIGDPSGSGLTASSTLLTTAQNGAINLALLSNFGGPTKTMPPSLGSPAINAAVGSTFTTDQRGLAISDGHPDLGAAEAQSSVVSTISDGSGAGSLRQALAEAAYRITFDPSLNGATMTLSSDIPILAGVAIDASALSNGFTISGAGANGNFDLFRNFSVSIVTFKGLTLTNGGGSNYSSGDGGAIYNTGALTLTQCTLSGNSTSSGAGGAIYNNGSGKLTLTQCTLSGNSSDSQGGAIFNSSGTVTLTQCTVSGNNSPNGAGIWSNGTVVLTNSIVAGNSPGTGPDIDNNGGILTLTGANFIGDLGTTGKSASSTLLTTAQNGAINLAPLGNYGGPTKTMPPLGGPAINAAVGSTFTTDQRGLAITDAHPDLGADEALFTQVTTTSPSGAGSLTAALASASHAVSFASTLNGKTITLTGTLSLPGDVIIDGGGLSGGITLSGAGATGNFGLFHVAAGQTAVFKGLTLTKGGGSNFAGNGGAIDNSGTVLLTQCTLSANTANACGAIHNVGTMNLTQCVLSGNTANSGGNGGAIGNVGTLTLTLCTLTGNTNNGSVGGGALFNTQGTATLTQCTLSGNTASNNGGAIENEDSGGPSSGTTTLNQCTLSGNNAFGAGGAIVNFANSPGGVTLNQCTLSGNSAPGAGALGNAGAAMTVNQCTISGNTATSGGAGGGIYAASGTLTLTNSIVAGNTASGGGPDVFQTVTSHGGNLIGNGSGSGGLTSGDKIGTSANPINPLLSVLGSYGGPTQTMILSVGSPAIDAAVNSTFTSDQRGCPIAGTADIGAAECCVVSPTPGNGILGTIDQFFSWTGLNGATFQVYLGSSASSLTLAASPGSTPSATLHGSFTAGVTYYWRVDSTFNGVTFTGPIFNFIAPFINTDAATTVLSAYATLNGSVNPGGAATTAFFQYGATTAYGSTTPVTNLGSGTSAVPVSFNVSGLTKGTTYHYRVVITSGSNTYDGVDQTFTTPAVASPANWHSAQITGLSGPTTANMADGARTGVAQPGANLYFYKGTDNNIWAVFLGATQWQQQQLTTLANVADWLAYDPNFSTLNYQGTDGNMWCVYYDSKAAKWTSQQLGTLPQGVTIAGDIVVDNYGGWNNIYYRGSDSHLYAVYFNGSAWVHTAIGGTATVKGNLAIQGNNHLVYYQSTDNNLWCFYYNGKVWAQLQLTTTGNVAGTVAVDNVGFTVYYKSNVDNSAWCGYSAGGPWTALQLDTAANLSASATSYSNIAPYPLNDCTVYLDNNGQCESLYFTGSQWTHAVLGDGGSQITGGLSLQVMNHWIFARRSDGSVVIFYLG